MKLSRSKAHIAAAMLHLDLALDWHRENDRAGGVPLLRIIRQLSHAHTPREERKATR